MYAAANMSSISDAGVGFDDMDRFGHGVDYDQLRRAVQGEETTSSQQRGSPELLRGCLAHGWGACARGEEQRRPPRSDGGEVAMQQEQLQPAACIMHAWQTHDPAASSFQRRQAIYRRL